SGPRIRQRHASFTRKAVAELVEGHDLQPFSLPSAPLKEVREGSIEARQEDAEAFAPEALRLLEGQDGLARSGTTADRHPALTGQDVQHMELLLRQTEDLAVVLGQGRAQGCTKLERRRQEPAQHRHTLSAQLARPILSSVPIGQDLAESTPQAFHL